MRFPKLAAMVAGAAICLASATMTFAQPQGGGPGGGRQGGGGFGALAPRNAMQEALTNIADANLLPDFTLTADQKTKIADIRTGYKAEVDKWKTDHAADIDAVKKQGEELRAARGNGGGGGGGGGAAPDPQKRQDYMNARRTLMESMPNGETEATALMAVLTPEQKTEVDATAKAMADERQMMADLLGNFGGGFGGGRGAGGGGAGGGGGGGRRGGGAGGAGGAGAGAGGN